MTSWNIYKSNIAKSAGLDLIIQPQCKHTSKTNKKAERHPEEHRLYFAKMQFPWEFLVVHPLPGTAVGNSIPLERWNCAKSQQTVSFQMKRIRIVSLESVESVHVTLHGSWNLKGTPARLCFCPGTDFPPSLGAWAEPDQLSRIPSHQLNFIPARMMKLWNASVFVTDPSVGRV